MEKKLAVVNLEALYKLAEEESAENEKAFDELEKKLDNAIKQYDKVVEQNKQLQTECNVYRTALTEIQAIANKSKNYSSTATKIFNKCNEVL